MRAERLKRIGKLFKAYIEGNYNTQQELSAWLGVSEGQISQDMKVVRAILREQFDEEEAKEDLIKRIKQHEAIIGKAFRDYEVSRQPSEEISTRYEKRPCRRCKGEGEKEGIKCERCDGLGYNVEELVTKKVSGQAGDPRFLSTIQKSIDALCKLMGHVQEKPSRVEGRLEVEVTQNYEGIPAELALQHRKLTLRLQEMSTSPEEGNGEVLDAEFTRTEEE